MMRTTLTNAGFALALILAATTGAMAEDKAPMPETRGMKDMDPALHDKWDKEGKQDPYKDCTPNAEKAAQQAEHPMPETRGMAGMDPKAHEVDCPEPVIATPDPNAPPKHIHKSPN
ncbi:MAG: hypothetical protein WC809_16450 [Sinimarinibacterium sp.]|jgi:hypothetical protein